MARRIDWDASNRQAKLQKWIRDNRNYSWLEDLPPHESAEIDAWAKRQVRKSVSRVRRQIEEDQKVLTGVTAQINQHLDVISTALMDHNDVIARKSGESLLNLMLGLNLTSVGNEMRSQIIETLGLLIIATSD